MRIGVDIDGVMYQWSKTARYMLREILPDSPYTKDGPLGTESLSWNYIQDNVNPEHWRWLWTEGVRLGLFRHGHMYPGTIKAIRQLSNTGDVVVVTHRPKQAVEDTMAWLAYHRLPLAGVHILTNMEPKSSVGKFDYFIDDKPENCAEMAKTGAIVAMPVRPWNRDAELDDVARIEGWDEFVDLVKSAYN